jgi:hypothetical protein
MNWIGIIQIVLIIAATGVSARGSQPNGRAAGAPRRRAGRVDHRYGSTRSQLGARRREVFVPQQVNQ